MALKYKDLLLLLLLLLFSSHICPQHASHSMHRTACLAQHAAARMHNNARADDPSLSF